MKVPKNNATSLVTACQNVVHIQKKARLDTISYPLVALTQSESLFVKI